ncbi:hypothetical protein ACWGJX_34445 [Streptomyces sp. NPDC054775]
MLEQVGQRRREDGDVVQEAGRRQQSGPGAQGADPVLDTSRSGAVQDEQDAREERVAPPPLLGPLDAVWWRCGHGQWETLEAALANPNDINAWHQRAEQRRHREQREQEQRTSAWGRPATDDPEARRLVHPRPPEPGKADPAPPCERCGLPERVGST